MIESVVDAHERSEAHTARSSIPTHAYIRRPPWRGAGAQGIAHEVSRRIALLKLRPGAAESGRLRPHHHIQPVLGNSRQRAAVQRMHYGPDARAGVERVAAISIVRVGPRRVETQPRRDREVPAELDTTVAGTACIAIVESRGRELVGDERIVDVGLE